jgi:hypothetical protein
MADYLESRDIEADISAWQQDWPNSSEIRAQWMRENPDKWDVVRLQTDGHLVLVYSETRPVELAVRESIVSLAENARDIRTD